MYEEAGVGGGEHTVGCRGTGWHLLPMALWHWTTADRASLSCHCTPKASEAWPAVGVLCPSTQPYIWGSERAKEHPARSGAGTPASVMAAPHHALRVASPVLQMGRCGSEK